MLYTTLNPVGIMILSGIFADSKFLELFSKVRPRLPPGTNLSDLIEYLPAKDWLVSLLERSDGLELLRKEPGNVISGISDAGLRSLVTEALFSASSSSSSLRTVSGRRCTIDGFLQLSRE